jgi:hypothetical protein
VRGVGWREYEEREMTEERKVGFVVVVSARGSDGRSKVCR